MVCSPVGLVCFDDVDGVGLSFISSTIKMIMIMRLHEYYERIKE